MKLHKTVAMIGMMGAGKTAVGTAVARLLNVPFIDSDDEIVKAANRSIAEIFERDGEAFFRAKEAKVIARLLSGPPVILSTGGGAYTMAENRAEISERGVALWLKADLETLWQRVRHKNTRPLLRTPNPRATLAEIMEKRDPIYALADLSVESGPGVMIDEMAQRVLTVLATRPDVLES